MTQHRTDITVRGFHLDLYGHVNNARYLEFLEEARWSMLDDRIDLVDWQKRGLSLTVVKISISYRRAASLGDKLEVRSALATVGRRSVVVKQQVFLKGTDTLVADAEVTFVVVDVKSERALPIEGAIADAFSRLSS